MAATGELAAELLARRIAPGAQASRCMRGALPFLIPLNAQSTWLEPAQAASTTS